MLIYHLRHAVRRLVREPAFTLAAVLTLALGVGANVAVFAVVEAVLLRPLPYPAAEALVTLNHRDQRTGITKEFVAIGDYVDIVDRQTAFASIAAWGKGEATVYGVGEPYQIFAIQGSGTLFDVLRIRPVLGRAFTPEDGVRGAAPVMLLGYEQWRNRFGGDPNVIGRTLRVGTRDRTIVGVTPPNLRFYSTRPADAILPMTLPTAPPQFRKGDWTFLVGRLKPGRTIADGTNDLARISRQMEAEHPQDNLASTYFATPGAPTDALSKFAWTTHKTNPENVTDPRTAQVQSILNDAHTAIMSGSSSIDAALAQAKQRVHDEVGIG